MKRKGYAADVTHPHLIVGWLPPCVSVHVDPIDPTLLSTAYDA